MIDWREYPKKDYEERICVICRKSFPVKKAGRIMFKSPATRPRHSKTCSRVCSRKYSKGNNQRQSEKKKSDKQQYLNIRRN